jgi:Fic family protein
MRVPQRPPNHLEDFLDLDAAKDRDLTSRIFQYGRGGLVGDRYVHWEKLRFLNPPEGLTHRQWWLGLKLARAQMFRPLPISDADGLPFHFAMPDPVLQLVHEIDRDASGRIEVPEQVTNPAERDRYIVSSLIEEAITSSQLEGAATTTPVAKEMLRSGRAPRNKGEQMILNNYRAMQFIRRFVGKPLDPKLVMEVHRVVTLGTLDDPTAAGRFRREDEPIVVVDSDQNVIHEPPPAAQLGDRLSAMCKFANGVDQKGFMHPLMRAVILHFWLAYDHPFVDGNGRTARALFYWSMLSSGYWLTEFISISRILKKSPARYPRSFLYSETDGNDLTYFMLFQLSVIKRAIKDLHIYLEQKAKDLRVTERLLRGSQELNHRQIALLSHTLKHPGFRYTIRSHQRSHGVVYQTARSDLLDLAQRGLLEQRRMGRGFVFYPLGDLAEQIQEGRHDAARDRA